MDALTYEPTEYLRGTFPTTLAITASPTIGTNGSSKTSLSTASEIASEIYLSIIISVCGIVVILAIIYLRKVYNARL